MDVVSMMDNLLGGGLEPHEKECLKRLTPQGLAKLNADIIRGLDPEESMAAFCKVFQAGLDWRQRLLESLPAEAQRVVAQKQRHRSVSTAELVYLNDCVRFGVLSQLVDPQTGGLLKQYDLRECGQMYLSEQLLEKSKQTQATSKVEVVCCRLASTTYPADLGSPFFMHKRPNGRPVLAVNPALSWFHEDPAAPSLLVSRDAADRLLATNDWPDDCSDISDASDANDFVPARPLPSSPSSASKKQPLHHQKSSSAPLSAHRKKRRLASAVVRFLIDGKETEPVNPKRMSQQQKNSPSPPLQRLDASPPRCGYTANSTISSTNTLSSVSTTEEDLSMAANSSSNRSVSGAGGVGGGLLSSFFAKLGQALPT